VRYDIPNSHEEDVIVNDDKFSIKHSSNRVVSNSGIKIIWTSNEQKQSEFVQNYSLGDINMIIVFVRFEDNGTDRGELEIIVIDKTQLQMCQAAYTLINEPVFKCLKGNCRGVEFVPHFFQKVIESCDFHIQAEFEGYNSLCKKTYDPIQRRLAYLKSLDTDATVGDQN